MADVAGPSRPGAAAFWSRDCILCPLDRGRRRLSRGERSRGTRSGREKLAADLGGGAVQSGRRAVPLLGY
ncbi:hypothetical protein E5288_WYG007142 [Bos mutus]|uniref:Uncharacterized protein n=1 Tax=Bos mutus TaxID=72004 RepID=A0A6B0QU09_9CETA|nr:hypothetical protein [Bos mutus]